jgi:multiple sugar transport system ATP-binding protein
MASVSFESVNKRFSEDALALKDFTLTIHDGELLVLVGPSGCGKSTTLRLLAGLEEVSSGKILINDQVVNDTSPQQRNVAMVFQNYALYPHMSVRENLEFPLRMTHTPAQKKQDKVAHIADILDLSDLLDRKPKQLSGGQRQRVAMGRALVRDPSVFLLDEPLSNLDAKLRAQIRADIAQLQKRLGKTTLYVTHDQVEAMTLGDRVAVINAGELQQVGTPDELYERPQNIFVARFIGSPGMNIIPSVSLKEQQDGIAIQIDTTSFRLVDSWQQVFRENPKYIGEKINIGIRPEAFSVTPIENGIRIEVKILSVEYLGHESLIYFQFADADQNETENIFIARVSGSFHHPDNTHGELYINPESLYLFDQEGRAIDNK